MDERTPLAAPADPSRRRSAPLTRRHRVRSVAAAGLLAALLTYFSLLTWLSASPVSLSGAQSPADLNTRQQQNENEEGLTMTLELPESTSASASATSALQAASPGGDADPSVASMNLLRQGAEHGHDETKDTVEFVPGFGAPLEKQYAGLIKVNPEAGGKIFYWFIEARGSEVVLNDETPLLIWLNGGPGASSMTGMLTEMGPYRITPKGKLIPHAQSWTQLGHMLFIDQPVGTGYSSVRDDSGYVNTQEEIAYQLYLALQGFYRRHPEYTANPLYVCGESYAGKYVPHIAHYIHEKNSAVKSVNNPDVTIRLAGVAIGNGMMWPVLQTRSVPDFAIALGLIDSQQYERANADISLCEEFHRQGRHIDAFQMCQSVTDSIYKSAGNPYIYDIRKAGNPFDDLTAVLSNYFNDDEVRRALNVPPGTPWVSIDGSSYGISASAPAIARHLLADEMLDVSIDTFRDLLDNYKFLFYAGNMDGSSCNNLGVGRMIDRLAWTGTVDYRAATRQPWIIDDKVAGLAKSSGNMSYVVVLNSGHLVPTDQPVAALDMMRRFLNDEPFVAS